MSCLINIDMFKVGMLIGAAAGAFTIVAMIAIAGIVHKIMTKEAKTK